MPATAQDRMTQDTCSQSWAATEALLGLPAAGPVITVDVAGWCAMSDVTFGLAEDSDLRMRSLRWRGSDLARFVNDGLPPRALEIEAAGIAVMPLTGSAVMDYALAVQGGNSSLDARLSVRWDGVQNAVMVEAAEVLFDAANRVSATARIDGVNLTDRAAIEASAGLRDLTVKSEFAGWFEEKALLPLASALLREDGMPPAAQVEAFKVQAIGLLDSLPDTVLPTPSRDALSAFVQTLPAPRGSAQLQFTARPPFGVARAMPFMAVQGLPDAEAFEGTSLLFTWAPKAASK
jgi:hypothetical protein